MNPPHAPAATPAVLVVGDSMLDRYWDGAVERISPEAPVPVLRFGHEWERAGGAANVAANLVALGSRTALATLLGKDDAGDRLARLMREEGILLHELQCADMPTIQKIRAVCKHHQLLRIDIEQRASADAARSLCELACCLLPDHPWVVLSDYGKGALAGCEKLIGQAREQGCRVMVDPKGQCFDCYRGAWLLKPNESEAAAVAGPWDSDETFGVAMEGLRSRLDLTHLLVTRGERGMVLFSADRPALQVPSVAREVFDVSGAGDTALAALAAFLAAGASLENAVRHANQAAGIAVGKVGTAVVSLEELMETGTCAQP
jgi:rfaE bifunctional protein kinase chain/domain